MKWEQFKNRLKKDAHQQEFDVNADEIWNAIEPQVDNLNEKGSRKRRFIIWFFFAGILAVGMGTLFLWEGDSNVELVQDEAMVLEETVEAPSTTIDKESSTKADLINQNLSEKIRDNQRISSNATPGEKNIDHTVTNKNTKNLIDLKSKDLSSSSDSRQKSTVPKSPETSFSKNKTSQVDTNNAIDLSSDESKFSPIDSGKIQKTKILAENILQHLPLKYQPLVVDKPVVLLSDDYFSLVPEEEESGKKGKKTKEKLKFSVEPFGGLSFVNRSLSAKNETANGLLQIREKYESTLEASHFGLLFGVQHSSGLKFSLGIQKTAIAENYELKGIHEVIDSIMGVQILRINLYGDTIPIVGMIPQTTTTIGNKNIFNTYRLIDLPIIMGYQHSFNKWDAGIQLGVLANISLKTEGIIPNELLEDINIKTQQSSIYKSNIGISYYVGLSLSRSVFDNFKVNFSPFMRFYPNSFSVRTYELSQKYSLIGGNIGMLYQF